MNTDTIAAIATAPGEGGIGIVRISGNRAEEILASVFRPAGMTKNAFPMESHRLTFGSVIDGGEMIDECMAVLMRSPKSYTREDVAEIQVHGGMQVLHRTLALCIRKGARLAEAGEFTRRAFLNGRIDLTQAEAVMRLISARGEQERRAAAQQMEGSAAALIRKASDDLYSLQAGLAACMDYPEEVSDEEGAGQLREGLEKLIRELEGAIDEHASGLLYHGMRVAFIGPPNAGKSSLLNTMLGEERAIVTAIPGTTRDTVEGELELNGVRVILTDTAGMRETDDPIERIGVERSEKAFRQADLALLVLDGSRCMTEDEKALLNSLKGKDAVVINKSDLKQQITEETVHALKPGIRCFLLSAMDRKSLEPLMDYLRGQVEINDVMALTQPRHIEAVRRAIQFMREAQDTLQVWTADMAATDLQAAQQALSEITGDQADEKLLDAVFSGFCVGK